MRYNINVYNNKNNCLLLGYSLTGKDPGDWSSEKDCLLATHISTTCAEAYNLQSKVIVLVN